METITVTNNGPQTATDIHILTVAPFGVDVAGADSGGSSLFGFTTWTVPSLQAGASVTLHLTLKTSFIHLATGTVQAKILSTGVQDPNDQNNSASNTVKLT